MSIPPRVKDGVIAVTLGVVANFLWDGIKQLRGLHSVGLSVFHFPPSSEIFQLLYFVVIAGVGVFLGERSAQKRIWSLDSQLKAEHILHLEKLSDEGNFWVFHYQQSHSLPIWQNGTAKWAGYTAQTLNAYYGQATEQAFDTFDGMDRQKAEEMDLRYMNRRLENLRHIIQTISS